MGRMPQRCSKKAAALGPRRSGARSACWSRTKRILPISPPTCRACWRRRSHDAPRRIGAPRWFRAFVTDRGIGDRTGTDRRFPRRCKAPRTAIDGTTSAKQRLRRSRPGQSARVSSTPCSVHGSGARRSSHPEVMVMRRCGSRMIAARGRISSSPMSASPAASSRRRPNSSQRGNSAPWKTNCHISPEPCRAPSRRAVRFAPSEHGADAPICGVHCVRL